MVQMIGCDDHHIDMIQDVMSNGFDLLKTKYFYVQINDYVLKCNNANKYALVEYIIQEYTNHINNSTFSEIFYSYCCEGNIDQCNRVLHLIRLLDKEQTIDISKIFSLLCCTSNNISILEYLHNTFGGSEFIVIDDSYGCSTYATSVIVDFLIKNNYITNDLSKFFFIEAISKYTDADKINGVINKFLKVAPFHHKIYFNECCRLNNLIGAKIIYELYDIIPNNSNFIDACNNYYCLPEFIKWLINTNPNIDIRADNDIAFLLLLSKSYTSNRLFLPSVLLDIDQNIYSTFGCDHNILDYCNNIETLKWIINNRGYIIPRHAYVNYFINCVKKNNSTYNLNYLYNDVFPSYCIDLTDNDRQLIIDALLINNGDYIYDTFKWIIDNNLVTDINYISKKYFIICLRNGCIHVVKYFLSINSELIKLVDDVEIINIILNYNRYTTLKFIFEIKECAEFIDTNVFNSSIYVPLLKNNRDIFFMILDKHPDIDFSANDYELINVCIRYNITDVIVRALESDKFIRNIDADIFKKILYYDITLLDGVNKSNLPNDILNSLQYIY